jgi:hypothetical protein
MAKINQVIQLTSSLSTLMLPDRGGIADGISAIPCNSPARD